MYRIAFFVGSAIVATCSFLLLAAVFSSVVLHRAFTESETIIAFAISPLIAAIPVYFLWRKLRRASQGTIDT